MENITSHVIQEGEKGERFVGEISIEPHTVDLSTWPDKNTTQITELVFEADGGLKLRKKIFKNSTVPSGIDDAEHMAAIGYDKNPKIEDQDFDPFRADVLLQKMEEGLVEDIEEKTKEMEEPDVDSDIYYYLEDLVYGDLQPELDKIQKARKTLQQFFVSK